MAESDTILQLGIEAAREGNREEARNLFGLLTRQEPDNAQAWLWLAGVADGPEQRRAALERAVELDPTNEMAVKGLQAMGAHPTVKLDEDAIPSTPAAFAAASERPMTEEERYAAELDSAFDDYDTVPRSETPRREVEIDDTAAMVGGAVAADRATSSVRSARERSAARRASTPIRSEEDDEMRVAPPSRPNNLLWLLVGLIALLLVGYLAYRFLFNRSGDIVADNPTAIATVVAGAGSGQDPTPLPTAEGQLGGTGVLTGTTGITPTTGLSDTTGITPTAVLTDTTGAPVQPPPAAQGPIPVPVANPNAQPVSLGTQLDANGWVYTYPDASYALVRGKQIGSFTAQGTYLHILVWVGNNTGTAQPIPAGYFALKDAQGTVYVGQPQVSSAAVQRGVNADASMEDAIPANGALTSVYLVFDVPPGAQGLFLFAAGKADQGWPLNVVP
ncbi:MAG: hypothetical protein M3R61_13340 [Chloroflexota bacterium]|nr:hypothetical protein [Chloroflexota bacterium]